MSDDGQADRERRVRDRAYVIWVEAGCPEGQADEHWRRAAEAVDQETAAVTPLTDLTDEPVPLVPPNR